MHPSGIRGYYRIKGEEIKELIRKPQLPSLETDSGWERREKFKETAKTFRNQRTDHLHIYLITCKYCLNNSVAIIMKSLPTAARCHHTCLISPVLQQRCLVELSVVKNDTAKRQVCSEVLENRHQHCHVRADWETVLLRCLSCPRKLRADQLESQQG